MTSLTLIRLHSQPRCSDANALSLRLSASFCPRARLNFLTAARHLSDCPFRKKKKGGIEFLRADSSKCSIKSAVEDESDSLDLVMKEPRARARADSKPLRSPHIGSSHRVMGTLSKAGGDGGEGRGGGQGERSCAAGNRLRIHPSSSLWLKASQNH